MSDEKLVLEERRGAVILLTLNRPDKRNALNGALRCSLLGALDAAARDTAVRVIVLTGAGDKAFVAGADIGEFAERTPLQQRAAMTGRRVFETDPDRARSLAKDVLLLHSVGIRPVLVHGGAGLRFSCRRIVQSLAGDGPSTGGRTSEIVSSN